MEEKNKTEMKKTRKPVEKTTKIVETSAPIPTKTKKSQSAESKGLIVVIRIHGEVKVKPEIVNTLNRLRLMRKYSCVLINSSNKALMGMLWKVRHYVAYGDIDKEMLVKLLEARAQKTDGKKLDSEHAASELISGKKLEELGIKPFFRLHPPRKGIDSKLQYPKGALGNHRNDINKLVVRML
jgi:large subunit ribosomal protein L30